ncbi:MAG: hypothetical protein VKI82_06170, partial [Leptolyngbya sp.]|nr:hypothetical protein [Leptolyngbya sp.]
RLIVVGLWVEQGTIEVGENQVRHGVSPVNTRLLSFNLGVIRAELGRSWGGIWASFHFDL